LFILCGLPLIHYLNFELNPQATSSSLSIRFSWYYAEPRVIEQEATSKLEALFAGVNGIKEISSTSGNGSGNIILKLDKGADEDAVRFEVSTLIRQVWPEMPEGANFPSLSVNLADNEDRRPLLSYNLNAPQSPTLVQQYADDFIKPALSQTRGISKIDIYGASPLEWAIEYDDEKLKSAGVTPGDIQNAVNRALKKDNMGVGLLPVNNKKTNDLAGYMATIPITLQTRFFSGADLLSTPVKKSGARIISLADIATVKHVEGQPSSYYRINGLNTINIVVYAAPGENNLVVGKTIKETVQRLISELPYGYELLLTDDSTEYISNELHNIAVRSLCTFLILLGFILLITRRWKHALLILVMLIGNLSIAVIFYYFFRLEIHLYALAGITVSLGLMTDNIIIMSDHIRTRGNRKAFLAILAGTMSTISSLVVIFFLEDQIKTNLVDFALIIIINQSVSLLSALFVIPALMDKLGLDKHNLRLATKNLNKLSSSPVKNIRENVNKKTGYRQKRRYIIRFTLLYRSAYLFLRRWRVIAIVILIIGFGLPIYMLPDKWEGDKWFNNTYNSTLGSAWYKERLKPLIDKVSGGAFHYT